MFYFQKCADDPNLVDKSVCFDDVTSLQWLDDNKITAYLFRPFSFIDFNDRDDPFKSTIALTNIGGANERNSYAVKVPL